MTVKELKEFLETIDENTEVVVQYRDDGGEYWGYDEELYLTERKEEEKDNKEKKILVL